MDADRMEIAFHYPGENDYTNEILRSESSPQQLKTIRQLLKKLEDAGEITNVYCDDAGDPVTAAEVIHDLEELLKGVEDA